MRIKKANDETIKFESAGWVHPKTLKAQERFNRPITDYGKRVCKHDNR